ncbi:MAG: MarR family transcriptional regulator [Myxococcota bacterium]
MTARSTSRKPFPPREIADRLHSVSIRLLRWLRRVDAAAGVGPARLSALSVLTFGGPMTLGQLAAAEQVKPPTMTRVVHGLEAEGLAQRIPDPADGRVVRVAATAAGKRLLQQGRRRRVEVLNRRVKELPAAELATLERAVEILERMTRGG